MVQFSFVLLCYNNWKMTKQAVNSLIDSFDPGQISKGIELIIVDNGSTDETPLGIETLKEEYESHSIDIKNVRLDPNMGYTPGINAGLGQCEGDILTILSNDLVFPPKWFNRLVEVLEGDKKIGLVAPYLSRGSGPQDVNKEFSCFDEMKAFAADFMEKGNPDITITHRVIGACMVFKREVIELIGGNDIWFGLGQFDDDDWCLRTMVAGFKIAIVGQSFVQHLSQATYNQQSELLNATFHTNLNKIQRKWKVSNIWEIGNIKEILLGVSYSKEHHYFPTKKEAFNSFPSQLLNKGKGARRILFVADWTHPFSQWKEKLLTAIQGSAENNDEIHLWIPEQYYSKLTILPEIKLSISPLLFSRLNIIKQEISPSDYLLFLHSFDAMYSVEDDFINRYFVTLAEKPIL